MKPWPASALDRVKTGLGVVLDDVAPGPTRGSRWASSSSGSPSSSLHRDIHWWCMELTP